MANFIKSALGGDNDLAKVAGKKVGSAVEEGVKSVISGHKGSKKEEKNAGRGGGGGGFGVGDAISLVTGHKDKKAGGGGGGGFGVGDALSLVTGHKDKKAEGGEDAGTKAQGGSGPGDAPAPQGEPSTHDDFSLEAGLDAN